MSDPWRIHETELPALLRLLVTRPGPWPVRAQLDEAVELGALRAAARRRAVNMRHQRRRPVAFGDLDAQRAALVELRSAVAHQGEQRDLVQGLIAGAVALPLGGAVGGARAAARVNARALLELGRPVVRLSADAELVIDTDPWPDPGWALRWRFAQALRCAALAEGYADDPLWVAADGRYGAGMPPAEARWVELRRGAAGERPAILLRDKRMRSGATLSWRAAVEALAVSIEAERTSGPERETPDVEAAALAWPEDPRLVRIAEDICADHGVPVALVDALMRTEMTYRARASRSGVLGALEDVLTGHVQASAPAEPPEPALVLLGCVKAKGRCPAPVMDLYRGQLWQRRRQYAEARGLPWAIVSAELGVVAPETVAGPYERRIEQLDAPAMASWRARAHDQLAALFQRHALRAGGAIEVIAGRAYVDALRPVAGPLGVELLAPLDGLGIGHRKQWLARRVAELGGEASAEVSGLGEGPVWAALGELVAARPEWCWWVEGLDEPLKLEEGDERDPDGWELCDVVAELAAAPPPVGAVLWGMEELDCVPAAVAVLDPDGWVVLRGARARLFARADAPIGRWAPAPDIGLVDTAAADTLDVACRWAARAAAQQSGVALAAIDWDALDATAIQLGVASGGAELAAKLHADVEGHREALLRLPVRGPEPSPAVVGPATFDAAWAQRQTLTVDRAGEVRARKARSGRPKRLTLAGYVRARAEVSAAGGDPGSNRGVARHLGVTRQVVIRRRKEYEALSAGALAQLEASVREEGLGAVVVMESATRSISAGAEAEPFLYWTGGKGRLLGELLRELPDGELDYCEPFLGGGALFLALAAAGRIRRAVLSDADADIAHLWRMVQRDPDGVHAAAASWPWTVEAYAQAIAAIDALDGVARAGAVLRVNRHARQGLWRRRKSDGRLNMPPGERAGQVDIGLTRAQLRRVSALLAHAEIRCADAEAVIDSIEGPGWVTYADPPYWPLSATAAFSGYDGRGFQAGDHVRTIAAMRRFGMRGGFGMLSNASTAPVLHLCEAAGAAVRWVSVYRSVSAKLAGRGKTPEIIAVWRQGGALAQVA